MLCIRLASTDPFFNLAADEYLLKNREEEFLILSVNRPSVVIGKHQVAHREADTAFVTAKRIPVIRRISGGGAVFHDEGNLNFSFLLQSEHGHQVDFRKYTLPVIEFLAALGIDAKFEGKNDLKVEGLKVSGNAEHVHRKRVLHHGTLLFNTDLDLLRKSLRKDHSAYSTRAVSSNPSQVMNLREKLPGLSMEGFISSMFGYFLRSGIGNTEYQLTDEENKTIRTLAGTKYMTWEWNYAYGPEYRIDKDFKHNGIVNRLSVLVKDGIINDCSIEGSGDLKTVSERLKGCRHMPGEVEEVIKKEGIKGIFTEWIF